MALEIDPIVHEDYNNPLGTSNDIALLKLAESVDLDVYTPACLADLDADYTGQNGRVYGRVLWMLQCSKSEYEKSFFWQAGDPLPLALQRAQQSCRRSR